MRAGSKLSTVVAALLLALALGLAACGDGDDDSGSTGASSSSDGSEHQDSGGGSAQFRVKGGDNSIQDFGEEADEANFEAAAETLHEFLDARAAGDWEAACATVSEEVRQSLEKLAAQAKELEDASCAGVLSALTNPAAEKFLEDEAEAADAASLRVQDDSGYIIYRASKGEVFALTMAEEDGEWKVAGLSGTPIR